MNVSIPLIKETKIKFLQILEDFVIKIDSHLLCSLIKCKQYTYLEWNFGLWESHLSYM